MNRKQREEALKEINLLDLAPVRAAEWEEVDGKVVVLRPEPATRGLRGLLDRFFHRMSARRIRLDEVGSVAWRLLDGKRTAAEVAEALSMEFGDGVEPSQQRLASFIWMMRREGLLFYPGWDDGDFPGRG